MKRILVPVMGFLFTALLACNNSGKKNDGATGDSKAPGTRADSLMEDVMDGHDVGMSKYGKMQGMLKKVQSALDSIARLPGKAQQAAAPYKAALDSAAKALSFSLSAMDKWMEEFNMDSAVNNMEERIKYLTEEKMKVGKVKEAILNSLQMADSVLKAKL